MSPERTDKVPFDSDAEKPHNSTVDLSSEGTAPAASKSTDGSSTSDTDKETAKDIGSASLMSAANASSNVIADMSPGGSFNTISENADESPFDRHSQNTVRASSESMKQYSEDAEKASSEDDFNEFFDGAAEKSLDIIGDDVSTHNSSGDSDAESDSSTLVYNHESFSTFESRVMKFAQNQIWPEATQQEISIERMKGGGFNRVIGLRRESQSTDVKVTGSETDKGQKVVEYVLRIPRFEFAQVDRDVAAIQLVKRFTTISVPSIVKFKETEDVDLGVPYMIQDRMRGTSIRHSYLALSHSAKCSVAQQLGDAYRQMIAIESTAAGQLSLASGNKRLDSAIHVVPFLSGEEKPSIMYNNPSDKVSIWSLMIDIFEAEKTECLRHDREWCASVQDDLCAMVSELDAQGWLGSEHFSLAHLDLEPRNILVDVMEGATPPCTITILDWDSAILGPKFMSCLPPMWLWAWKIDDEEDEREANDEPVDPEMQQVKRIFEEAAGPGYLRYAYEPAYRFARRLFRFLITLVEDAANYRDARELLEEWQAHQKKRDREVVNGLEEGLTESLHLQDDIRSPAVTRM